MMFWKKWLAVLLTVCLLLTVIAGCTQTPEPDDGQPSTTGSTGTTASASTTTTTGESTTTGSTTTTTTASTTSTTKSTGGATKPTSPPADQPLTEAEVAALLKSEPLKGISVPDEGDDPLTFTLTEKALQTLQARFDDYVEALMLVKDLASLQTLDEKLSEIFAFVHWQTGIAQVLYYVDMTDTAAEADYTRSYEATNAMQADAMAAYTDLYASKETYRKQFFKDWTDEELAMLVKLDDKIVAMKDRNIEIENEALDTEADGFDTKVGKLYAEFVQNNNAIAAEYGYDNFYEYATETIYGRDYGAAERQQFRKLVFDKVLALNEAAYEKLDALSQTLTDSDIEAILAITDDDYRYAKNDLLDRYLNSLPTTSGAAMSDMFDYDRYITSNANGAFAGAFTTLLDDAYCFFGPGNQNMQTYVHELGHYYAYAAGADESLPFDLAEVHSQGNESLFIVWLEGEISQAAYEYIKAYQIYYFSEITMVATLVDAFEEQVYGLASVKDYTSDSFDAVMESVVKQWVPKAYQASFTSVMNQYWRYVTISSPVYYISYATSAIASLSVMQQAEEDFDAAKSAYKALVEDCSDLEFREAMEAAGFADPFEDATYEQLLELVA